MKVTVVVAWIAWRNLVQDLSHLEGIILVVVITIEVQVIAIFVEILVILAGLAPEIHKLKVDRVVRVIAVVDMVNAGVETKDNRVGLVAIQHKDPIQLRVRWSMETTINSTIQFSNSNNHSPITVLIFYQHKEPMEATFSHAIPL